MVKVNQFYSEVEMEKHDWENTGEFFGGHEIWKKNDWRALREPKTGKINNILDHSKIKQ